MKKQILCLLLACTSMLALRAQHYSPKLQDAARKTGSVLFAIDGLYVDSVNITKVGEDAIRGMLEKLDPHSTYSDPEEAKEQMENMDGKFGGIGVQFNLLTDTVYVVQVIPGGPSEKAGIQAGDRILTVDGKPIAGQKMKNTEVMKLLRGPEGSRVNLGIFRNRNNFSLTVTRGEIPINSMQACYLVPNTTIGYINLSQFGATTYKEFVSGVESLHKKGMQSLILDLRYNGGGLLDQAKLICSEFLPQGSHLLEVRNNRKPAFSEKLLSTAPKLKYLQKLPLAILINEFSASAAEIVAGAMQDQDRATLIGRRSFGKGLVQRPIPLSDGSMIRLTIARYYTPGGRCIQKSYAKGQAAYEEDILNRFKHGELMHADSIHFPDSLRYQTLRLKRTIYGGGGIMPDIFIPLDTTRANNLERSLVNRGIYQRIMPNFLDLNRKRLKKEFPAETDFLNHYEVPQTLIDKLLATAAADSVKWVDSELREADARIRKRLKAAVAGDLYSRNIFYLLLNSEEPDYNEAVRLLTDEPRITLQN